MTEFAELEVVVTTVPVEGDSGLWPAGTRATIVDLGDEYVTLERVAADGTGTLASAELTAIARAARPSAQAA